MGGNSSEFERRVVLALERIAAAFENTEEEVVQEGAPPSVCPFCGTENPTVSQLGIGAGPVDEFVLIGETHCCNRTVYGVPVQMLIAPDRTTVDELQIAKKGGK
jgi:hypothetical protein